jgi:hypothetical protein
MDAGSLDRPEPGSACCRPSYGSGERCHGGAEAAAPGERDPSPGLADEEATRVEICRVLLNPPILADGAEYWLD